MSFLLHFFLKMFIASLICRPQAFVYLILSECNFKLAFGAILWFILTVACILLGLCAVYVVQSKSTLLQFRVTENWFVHYGKKETHQAPFLVVNNYYLDCMKT